MTKQPDWHKVRFQLGKLPGKVAKLLRRYTRPVSRLVTSLPSTTAGLITGLYISIVIEFFGKLFREATLANLQTFFWTLTFQRQVIALLLVLTGLMLLIIIVQSIFQVSQLGNTRKILQKFPEVEHVEEVLDPDAKEYEFEGKVYLQLSEEIKKAEESICFLTIATLGEEWIFSDDTGLPENPSEEMVNAKKAQIALQQAQVTAQQEQITAQQVKICDRQHQVLEYASTQIDDPEGVRRTMREALTSSKAALQASRQAQVLTRQLDQNQKAGSSESRQQAAARPRVITALDKYKFRRDEYLETFKSLMSDKLETKAPGHFWLKRIYQQSPSRWQSDNTPGPLETLSQKHVDQMIKMTENISEHKKDKGISASMQIIVAKDSRNTGFVIIDGKTLIIQLSATDKNQRPYMASLLIYRLEKDHPFIRSYTRRFNTIWSVAMGEEYRGRNVLLNWKMPSSA